MLESRKELVYATVTAIAGALIGAVVGYLVADGLTGRIPGFAALLVAWAAGSIVAGITSYAAARTYTANAGPLAFSVFVFSGVMVYPGIALYAVFEPPLRPLLLVGAILAGAISAVLVTRLNPAS